MHILSLSVFILTFKLGCSLLITVFQTSIVLNIYPSSMIKHPNFIYVSAPDDFESVSGTLIFSSDVTESCFTVMIVDDSIRESVPECFTVTIVDATGDIESPSVATVCIEDNDGNLKMKCA